MTKLTLSTAALALMAAPALADGHAGIFPTIAIAPGEAYTAEELEGTRVHAFEQEFEVGTPVAAGAQAEWDDIGEIDDIVIGADGTILAVIVDVGGFLGIGEREVAVAWSALQPVVEDDDPDEVFLVVNASRAMLEAAPEFEDD